MFTADAGVAERNLLERAADKNNVAACFTSAMTIEEIKSAMKLAREKAKKAK